VKRISHLIIGLLMAGGLAAFGAPDETRKIPTIGQVWFTSPAAAGKSYDQAFREGLRTLGYVDGKNITIIPGAAEGNEEQLPIVVKKLIAIHVDVIVVSPKAVRAAIQATKTIPIVCPDMGNPVRDGLVASLSHPGGNLTGGYALDTETNAKRLELIAEVVPMAKDVGVLFDANDLSLLANANALSSLARRIGVRVRTLGVRNWREIQAALGAIDRGPLQALIVFDNPLTELHLAALMRLVAHRLPVVSEGKDWSKAGALLTYGVDYHDMWKDSAKFVDKILRGAKPSDIPIEQPTKFDLTVNLRTAKALGITIPESILLRADEIIK
jgi:putative ABC transport system substrate-binding protein